MQRTILIRKKGDEGLAHRLELQRSMMFQMPMEVQKQWHKELEEAKVMPLPSKWEVSKWWPRRLSGHDVRCGFCMKLDSNFAEGADWQSVDFPPLCAGCRRPLYSSELWRAARLLAMTTGDAQKVVCFLNDGEPEAK